MKKKLIFHSNVKRNQPDRYRFCKADMDKHAASTVQWPIKVFQCWKIFHIIWHNSQISVPNGNKPRIESVLISGVIHSHLFNLKQSLTCFGDKPLANLYSSVGRTCIFLWCTETELSIAKGSVKKNVLSLYLIRTQSLVWPIYLVV